MASKTEIINLTLTYLGQDLQIEGTEVAGYAPTIEANFPMIRDATLRAARWKFAEELEYLALSPTPPKFGFQYSYKLPTDPYCLKAWELEMEDKYGQQLLRWRVKGRNLHTDLAQPVGLVYVARVEDTEAFDPQFNIVLARHLEAVHTFRVTQDRGAETAAYERYEKELSEGRAQTAQEGSPLKLFQDQYVGARR